MKKNPIFEFILLSTVVVIIVIILGILSYYWQPTKDDERKMNTNDVVGRNYAQINYNNSTKTYEVLIGPIMDADRNPMENANISIEINGTTFYNLTDSMGFSKIIIPEKSISIEDLNSKKNVIAKTEGYKDLEFVIYLLYP